MRINHSSSRSSRWTSTACEVGGLHGFFVGNFDTGEVFCGAAHESSAQPLCIH